MQDNLTVDELIGHLQDLSDQGHGTKLALFTYNYGDHWRTTVAANITSVETGKTIHSEYHSMDKVVSMEDDTYYEMDDNAVLLS